MAKSHLVTFRVVKGRSGTAPIKLLRGDYYARAIRMLTPRGVRHFPGRSIIRTRVTPSGKSNLRIQPFEYSRSPSSFKSYHVASAVFPRLYSAESLFVQP